MTDPTQTYVEPSHCEKCGKALTGHSQIRNICVTCFKAEQADDFVGCDCSSQTSREACTVTRRTRQLCQCQRCHRPLEEYQS
jgi:hypothetical protein